MGVRVAFLPECPLSLDKLSNLFLKERIKNQLRFIFDKIVWRERKRDFISNQKFRILKLNNFI